MRRSTRYLTRIANPRQSRKLPAISQGTSRSARWVTGCAEQGGVGYAAGNGATLSIGRINEVGPRSFAPLALATRDVIHESDPRRDRVQRLCRNEGALAVVLTTESELLVVWCEDSEPSCRSLSVSKGVSSFAALSDPQGVLLAYAGDADAPQIFVRRLDLRRGALTPARIAAPCWASSRGLCGQPILERLGARVLLGARQGTDLLLLESGDEGATWTKPSVL